MIASTLATWGPNVVTFKPLLDALKFTEIEAQQLSLQPSSRISTMAQKILSSQGKLSQFKLLMEREYLRGAFPTYTEFDLGYPIPNSGVLVSFAFNQEDFRNSKFLKQDTVQVARQERIYVQIHHSVFPDRSPIIYGQDFSRGSTFFLNIWYMLEYREFYHLIQMDYLLARQLSYMQSHKTTWSSAECVDYSQYLDKRKNSGDKFLNVVSFNSIDPFNWMQEKQKGLIDPYRRTSETKDYDMVAQSQIGISTAENQLRLSGIQLNSPSKPIQQIKMGTAVSYVMNRIVKDEDIESIIEGADNFIFLLRTGETFKMDKSILKDSLLSQEVGRRMGQVPPLIEQVGATLLQGMNQSLSIDECCLFASPSKKIKKDQKSQEKLNRSNRKNPRGGRGQRKN